MKKQIECIAATTFCLVFLFSTYLWAAPPFIHFQGKLVDNNTSQPVTNLAGIPMTFVVYDQAVGGTRLFEEDQSVVVENGIYNVQLGKCIADSSCIFGDLPAAVAGGTELWLEVWIDLDRLDPRQQLTSTTFALEADTLDGNDSADFVKKVELETPGSSSINWTNLDPATIPAGFTDNIDNDALGNLSCSDSQIAKFNQTNGWLCSEDLSDSYWTRLPNGSLVALQHIFVGETAAGGAWMNITALDEPGLDINASGDQADGIRVTTDSPEMAGITAKATAVDATAIKAEANGDATSGLVVSASGIPAIQGAPGNRAGTFNAYGMDARAVHGRVFDASSYAGYFEGGKNYFSGSVGIGNATPQEALDVNGNIVVSGAVISNGTAITGAYVAALEARIVTLESQMVTLESQMAAVNALLANITREGNDIYIAGANLHILNGLNSTDTVNGLGNLIVGYNAARTGGGNIRTGSHNLIVGDENNFSSYGGIAGGSTNAISGPYASSLGGSDNNASGNNAVVSGGYRNTASGLHSTVSGGSDNVASGQYSSVSGGGSNQAIGLGSAISGGTINQATQIRSSVSGGIGNNANGNFSAVSGGGYNSATGMVSSVSAGNFNTAAGEYSAVSGGRYNQASGDYSSVTGGGGPSDVDGNIAFADYSAILGGQNNLAGDGDCNFDPSYNRTVCTQGTDHSLALQSTVSGGFVNAAGGRASSVGGGYGNNAARNFSAIPTGKYVSEGGQ